MKRLSGIKNVTFKLKYLMQVYEEWVMILRHILVDRKIKYKSIKTEHKLVDRNYGQKV